MQLRKMVSCAFIVVVVLACCAGMFAQTATTGSISGSVTDPSGALIPGAKIAITSDAGVHRDTTASQSGYYTFNLLAPGNYRVEISAAGFAAAKVENVEVRITENTPVDIKLAVGAHAQETVNVSEVGTAVQADNATKGSVIDQEQIRQLPLPTRNFQQLLTLTTGTSAALENSSDLGRGDQAIYVNGQRSLSNNVLINGVDANSIGTGSMPNLAVPSTDTLQEFIVQTSLYDASQGRNAGGVVAAVTKSGTNHFHGNVYEFLRNTVLDGNNYFLNAEGVDRPKYNRNQFGFTVGGPIVKDRVWFFGSYQGTREINGTSLSNSLSTMFIPGNLGSQRDLLSLEAFSASYGLAGYIDPVALNILQAKLPNGQYVIPSVPGAVTGVGSNTPIAVTIPSNSTFNEDQFNTNLDVKLSEKHHFSGKFFWADNTTDQALYDSYGDGNPLQAPGWSVQQKLNQRLLSLDVSSVLSSRMLNDARFGWNTIFGPSKPAPTDSAASLGISSPLASVFPDMPTLSFANMFTSGPSPLALNFSEATTYSAGDMMTWTRGRHTMKFGGEYKRQILNAPYFDAFTNGEIYLLGFTGSPMSDFLLGLSGLSVIGSGVDAVHNRANDFDFYYQDDWKVNSHLTLNVGLRWDYFGPTTSTNGQFITFDPTQATTFPLGPGLVGVNGGFFQAGNGNLPGIPKTDDGLVPANYKNFQPRLGFAYSPFSNIVLRGGYGIYFDRPNMRAYNSQLFNMPYNMLATALTTPLYDPFVHVPLPSAFPLLTSNAAIFPFGGYPPVLPYTNYATGPSSTVVPATGIYPDRHDWGIPYVQQYNLGVQWSFASNWMADLGYVGSVGRKFPRLWSFNQIGGPTPFFPGFSDLVAPGLGSFQIRSNSNSSYNSLQASLSKRFSKSLQLLASYTYAHSLDDYSGTDVSDITLTPGNLYNQNNYATSDFDRRHRFVASYVYDLPKFYKGSGFLKHVVDGWQTSGIVTLQSGTPFSIIGSDTAFSQTRGDLASGYTVASATKSGSVEGRLDAYFNPAAFVAPTAAGDFGTLGRNIMRGPAQTDTDMSFVKFIPVREGSNFEFRAEFFNLFNQVNFANPQSVITAPYFGHIVATSTGPRVVQFALKFNF